MSSQKYTIYKEFKLQCTTWNLLVSRNDCLKIRPSACPVPVACAVAPLGPRLASPQFPRVTQCKQKEKAGTIHTKKNAYIKNYLIFWVRKR